MAQYRLLANCYIDGQLFRATSIIEQPDDWQGPKKSRQTIGGRDDWGLFHEEAPLFERIDETLADAVPVVASSRMPPPVDLVRHQAKLNAEGARIYMRANLNRSKFSGRRPGDLDRQS
jgi:hypothetical protein